MSKFDPLWKYIQTDIYRDRKDRWDTDRPFISEV